MYCLGKYHFSFAFGIKRYALCVQPLKKCFKSLLPLNIQRSFCLTSQVSCLTYSLFASKCFKFLLGIAPLSCYVLLQILQSNPHFKHFIQVVARLHHLKFVHLSSDPNASVSLFLRTLPLLICYNPMEHAPAVLLYAPFCNSIYT